jgi:hypothetical protein
MDLVVDSQTYRARTAERQLELASMGDLGQRQLATHLCVSRGQC